MTGRRVFRGAPAAKAEVVGALEAALKAARAGSLGDLHIKVHGGVQGDPPGMARLMVVWHKPGMTEKVEVGEWVPEGTPGDVPVEKEGPVAAPVKKTVVKRKS